MNAVKQLVRRHFPGVLKAYHDYRHTRALHARKAVRTPHGFVFAGHPEMEAGTFEAHEAAVVLQRAKDHVYVDVGANYGYFVAIARNAGAHVVACEPLHENLIMLYENLRLNGWGDVEVFPLGMAAAPGFAQLYGAGTGASLIANWAGTSQVWQRTIALSTLDIVMGDRFANQKLFIKIDVEGAELGVLQGAQQLLDRTPAPAWMIEICFRENQPGGCINPDFRAIFEIFWSRGYRATTVWSDVRDVTLADVDRWLSSGKRDFGYVNYLFEKEPSR